MQNIKKHGWFILLSAILITMLGCSITDLVRNQLDDLVNEIPGTDEIQELVEDIPDEVEDLVPGAVEDIAEQPIEEVEEAFTTSGDVLTITSNDLSQLTSYRVTYIADSDGQSDTGNPLTQHIEIYQDVINPENTMHERLSATGSGIDSVAGNLHIFIVGDQTYMFDPSDTDFTCIMMSGGEELFSDIQLLEPDDYFDVIQTEALLESGVMINGVLTNHYKVSETGIDIDDITSQGGDLWLAQDGRYIVRYYGEADGLFDTGDETGTGSVRWKYDLHDIDQVPPIQLPPECLEQQQSTEAVPIPGNATNKEILSGIVSFKSPDNPDQVVDFYRQKLPEEGWTITEDQSIGPLVMMSAEKNGKTLQIVITAGEATGSNVIITTKLPYHPPD
ncbi:MAG: hypothetical protein MUO76_08080 [Anaerolineaceae bacterium]|nr:hypothetical protein [Anaerolineaceae bacterium]